MFVTPSICQRSVCLGRWPLYQHGGRPLLVNDCLRDPVRRRQPFGHSCFSSFYCFSIKSDLYHRWNIAKSHLHPELKEVFANP